MSINFQSTTLPHVFNNLFLFSSSYRNLSTNLQSAYNYLVFLFFSLFLSLSFSADILMESQCHGLLIKALFFHLFSFFPSTPFLPPRLFNFSLSLELPFYVAFLAFVFSFFFLFLLHAKTQPKQVISRVHFFFFCLLFLFLNKTIKSFVHKICNR